MTARYLDVQEQFPRIMNLPPDRRLLVVQEWGVGANIRIAKKAPSGFKWVFNTKNKKYNLVPINNRNLPIRQNYRINNWKDTKISKNIINKVFPKNFENNDIEYSPLRPSLFGVKIKFLRKLSMEAFSKLAYDFARKKFAKGVSKIKVFSGRFEPIAEVKTRNQQLNLTKAMFTSVNRFPNRIDVTMDDYNVQIYATGIIINGGYKEPVELNVNRLDGRVILGKGVDVIEGMVKSFFPFPNRPIEDYIITNMNMDFSVNQKIVDPFIATKNGNELSDIMRNIIKKDRTIPDFMLDYVPRFSYEKENLNETSRFNLAEIGGLNKIPDNIYIKFPVAKGQGKDTKKSGGSYVSWKKGYVRIMGADSLLKVIMIVRTIKLWYFIMKRDNPGILEKQSIKVAKKKEGKKLVAKKENIEKLGTVKLEVYSGRDGSRKLRINGRPCMDVSKKGYTSKEIKVFGAKLGILGADRMKRELLCAKLLNIATENSNGRNNAAPRFGFKEGVGLVINGKKCMTLKKEALVDYAKRVFISNPERLTRPQLCERLERVARNQNDPSVKRKLAKARGIIRRAVTKKRDENQKKLWAEMQNELNREFGSA